MKRSWLAGAGAGAVAVFVLLIGQRASGLPGALEATASGVTFYVPPEVFEAILSALGPWAKGLLFAGVALGACILGGTVGAIADRSGLVCRLSWPVGLIAVWTVSLLTVGVVLLPIAQAGPFGLDLPGDGNALILPLVGATFAYAATLLLIVRLARATGSTPPAIDRDGTMAAVIRPLQTRREILGAGVLLAVGGVTVLSIVEIARRIAVAASRPQIVRTRADGDPFHPPAAVTPISEFYVVGVTLEPPQVDLQGWSLAVAGLAGRPRSFTLDELRAFPTVSGFRTLQCVDNPIVEYGPLIGNQFWRGLRAADLFEAVEVDPSALYVNWQCADGYTESIPLSVARLPTTWLVYDMGEAGAPLPAAHGHPLRVLIADRYGYKQPKYLTEIVLSRDYTPGFWVKRRWDKDAFLRTYSRIDSPTRGSQVPVGEPTAITGVAWAGDRGIRALDISVDDGRSWRPAALEPLGWGTSELTWRRWRADVKFERPGATVVVARAIDGTSAVQDPTTRAPIPAGATGWHRVPVTALLRAPSD